MTVNRTENLMMTGRRLLRLARSLHRMTRLDGTLASYQGMLVNPLCRLNSTLDSLSPSTPYGTERAATPLAWRPSHERYESETSPRQSYFPEAQSPAPVGSRHGATLVQGANVPLARSGSESQAVMNSATPRASAPLPEAYLMSKQVGWRTSAKERRAALPTASRTTSGITRTGTAGAGDSPIPPTSTPWSESALTPAPRTNIAAGEALGMRLRPTSDSRSLPQERGIAPSPLTAEGQDGVGLLDAGDSRYTPPEPKNQRRAAPPADPQPGSVRLSRGGASLMSILRHNLAPGQSLLERRGTGFSAGSTPAPEGNGSRSGNNHQVILESRLGYGGLAQHHDASDAWGSGGAPRQLSPEQIDQIMDTLAEQLEIALLRTYGTTRR